MENELQQLESTEDRTAFLHLADEKAVVNILEILAAYPAVQQDLILQTVDVNRKSYGAWRGSELQDLRRVVMDAPVSCAARRRISPEHEWREIASIPLEGQA